MYQELPTSSPSRANFQEAYDICMALLKSLRLTKQLGEMIDEDHIPLAEIKPLPAYAATDPRASDLHPLMERLHVALSVVDGLRGAVAPAESHKSEKPILVQWGSARAQAYVNVVKRFVLPRAYMSVWKGKREILADLSRYLKHCLYDSEEELSREAARYAAERHAGIILFLAICPNIPLILPTLEIRLLFTKPLLAISKSVHAIFGRFLLIGFFLSWLVIFAQLFDAIPRIQVRVVQNLVMHRWLTSEQKRLELIRRYVRAVDARIVKPRADAVARGLLSIVS